MKKLIFLLSFLWMTHSYASSMLTCGYVLEITKVETKSVNFKFLEATKENTEGSTPKLCQDLLKQKTSIPLEQITTGKEWLQVGAKLKAKWSTYSGMGPNGPVSSTSWDFFKP